jgi:hypothetical protein
VALLVLGNERSDPTLRTAVVAPLACRLMKGDFYQAFGEPSQIITAGDRIYWCWKRKDGAANVVLLQLPLTEGIGLLDSINDGL